MRDFIRLRTFTETEKIGIVDGTGCYVIKLMFWHINPGRQPITANAVSVELEKSDDKSISEAKVLSSSLGFSSKQKGCSQYCVLYVFSISILPSKV